MCSLVISMNAESNNKMTPTCFRGSKTIKVGKYSIYSKTYLWISTYQKYLANKSHPARKT